MRTGAGWCLMSLTHTLPCVFLEEYSVCVKRLFPILLLVFSVGVGASGVHECDELTANSLDAQRVTDGISEKEFKGRGTEYAERAIRACTQAVDTFPEEARLFYQLGRALHFYERAQEVEWWLKLAIKKEYCYACTNYAIALRERNRKEQVISVVQEGAEKGCPAAQSYLGWLYKSGYGRLARDYAEARKWYQRAILHGHSSGAAHMGTLNYEGKGVPRNRVLALYTVLLFPKILYPLESLRKSANEAGV